jgi:hypothetical protein
MSLSLLLSSLSRFLLLPFAAPPFLQPAFVSKGLNYEGTSTVLLFHSN